MAEGAPNNLTLSVLSGPSSGESYALEGAVGHVILGSGESAHIQFDSPAVVENHVRLAIDEQGAAVAPASPDAPVFLNDDPVTDDTPLKNGDILWMGNPGDEGAVMIQCHLEPAAPAGEVVEESELAPVEAEMAIAEEPAIEAEPEEAAFVESAEPVYEPDFAVEEADLVAPTEAEGASTADVETAPELPSGPDAPAPEPMVVEEPEAEVDEAAEVQPHPDDADQETVFLGAAETTPALAEPAAEALPEDAASATEPVPPPEPEATAAEAPPPSEEPPASPPLDDPQPWEEQPEDSVKAAWEVEQAPEPQPPAEDTPEEPPPPPVPVAKQPAAATPTTKPAVRRPPPRVATRTSRPEARPAPPPAASSSGKMMGIAAGVVVLVGGAAAAFFMLGRGGSDPAPTPPPATVAQTLAPPTTLSVTEELLDEVALDEAELSEDGSVIETAADATAATLDPQPTPSPPPPAATPAPTPDRAAAARLLRERQAKQAPTPTPAPRQRATPAPATPAPVAQPSAAERQARQVATLMGQADQAMAASDFPKAQSLYDAVLELEPSNAKARSGQSQAATSAAAASKSFVAGRTIYISKGKKGSAPAGFSDGSADPKYKGSLTIELSPPKARPGATFTAKVFMTNEGSKDIKPKQVTFTTRLNGKQASVNAAAKVKEIKPGQRALVAETTGTWQAGTKSWIFEAKIISGRGDQYRTRLTWK